jgi:hypothetical protein
MEPAAEHAAEHAAEPAVEGVVLPAPTAAGRGLEPANAVVRRLVAGVPRQFAGLPPARRDELAKEFVKGVARRRDRFDPAKVSLVKPERDTDAATDPRVLISAQRKRIRAAALRAAIPDGRAEAALQGLSCLDPRDQNPEILRRWLDDPDQLTAVLAGPTGNGKTMAAYALAAEAALHGAMMRTRGGGTERRLLVVRAWTVNGYLAELRPDGSPDPPWAIRNRARWAELLILDDLGAEVDAEAREFARRELVELLEYRLENRLRTVFTTNLRSVPVEGAMSIEQVFHDRFWSRLNDRATGVLFTGPDRRNLGNLVW